MSHGRLMMASLALVLSVLWPAPAAAQPAAPVLVAPSGTLEGSTLVFTWRATPGATWYQLYISDLGQPTPRFSEWYTATQAQCQEGTGICKIGVSADLGAGFRIWWVRGWNAQGNSGWSNSLQFTMREGPKPWGTRFAASERFQVVLDGAGMLDRETGLVWQREWPDLLVGVSWNAAVSACATTTSGSGETKRHGFRLPTLDEALTLFVAGGAAGRLPEGHLFTGLFHGDTLWTSTAADGGGYWTVSSSAQPAISATSNRYLCVRGRM